MREKVRVSTDALRSHTVVIHREPRQRETEQEGEKHSAQKREGVEAGMTSRGCTDVAPRASEEENTKVT